MRPPPLPHQIHVLERVLDRVVEAAEGSVPPVVIFGLDGTLFDTRPRTLQILMEYAEEVRGDDPDVADALATLDGDDIHPLLSDTLRGCSLTHSDIVRDVTNYWRDRYYADEYLVFDAPAAGAPEYVLSCHEAGAIVMYVSTRDVPGMLMGTITSLRDHGFPFAVPGVELVLKPDATLGDEAFKREWLPTLDRCGSVVGFFDNEPMSCSFARELFPESEVVLLEHRDGPHPPPLEGVEPLSDFRIQ